VNYSIKLLPEARTDIKDIIDYYEEQQSGLGARFFKQLLPSIRQISQHPAIFQIRHKKVRQAPVKKLPIWIHYLIEETEKQVVIIAVTHSSRNPQVWKDR